MNAKKVLNYRIILEPEKMGKKIVYNAYCPTLNIADYGDTIEEALTHIKEGIELALEVRKEENDLPQEDNIAQQVITSIQVSAAL